MPQRTSAYNLNDTTFRVTYGDITQVDADILISSDDNHLSMGKGIGKGVAASLLEAGGEVIRQDAHKHLPLNIGDVIVTSAGRLSAKYIFHTVTIDRDNMIYAQATDIQVITLRCLQLADMLGMRCIAFPALGTGIAGFPFHQAAEVMTRTIADYLAGDTKIKLVILTLFAAKGINESDLSLFYERAVALASIATQSKGLNQLVNELQGIIEQMKQPDLLKSVLALQSQLAQAQIILAESPVDLEQLDQLEVRSGIAQVSQQVVAISSRTQAAMTRDNRQQEVEVIQTKLSGLLTQLNIQYANLNKLQIKKAKYGLDVPLYIENAIEDLQNEIDQIETRVEETRRQLTALT